MPPITSVRAKAGAPPTGARAAPFIEHLRAAAVLVTLLVVFLWKPIKHYDEVHYAPADLTQSFSLTKIEPGFRPGNQLQSDAVTQMEPWLMFNRDEFAAGRFPLWNPYNGTGSPHFANYQSAVLSPYQLPGQFLSFRAALLANALAKLFVLGFFTYLFLRRLRLAWIPALVGGTAFMFAGHNVLLLYFPHVAALCVMPVGLYCAEVVLQRFERGLASSERARFALPLAGLALAITAGLLAGNPEPFYFGALVLFVWTLARLARLARVHAERRRAVTLVAVKIGFAAAIGVGLAAVQLVPFFEYLHHSRVYEERSAHQTPLDPRWWPLALFPDILGSPSAPYMIGFDVPSPNYELVNMQYTGGLATFLFLSALMLAWRDRKVLFFGLAGLVWLVYAHDVGGAWRVFAWIPSVDIAPINRSQAVWAFLVSCAAACALDRVVKVPASRRWWFASTVLVAAGAFLVACLAGAERIIEGHAHLATPYVGEFRNFVPRHVAWMTWAFVAGAVGFAALAIVRTSAPRAVLSCAVLLAVFAQSGLWLRDYNPVCEDRFFFPRTAAISELQRLVGRERLAVLGEDMLPPDSNLAYGLNLLQSYDGMWVRDLDHLYRDQFGNNDNWRPITQGSERALRLFGTPWVLAKWGWNFLDSGRQNVRRNSAVAPLRCEVTPGNDVTQTFRADKNDLDAVMVHLSVLPRGEPRRLTVELKDAETGRLVHRAETTGAEVLSTLNSRRDIRRSHDLETSPLGRPVVFTFPPEANSRGRTFELRLSSPDTNDAGVICAWSVPRLDPTSALARRGSRTLDGELAFDYSCAYARYERVARIAEFELFRLKDPTGEFSIVDNAVPFDDDEQVLGFLRSPSFDPAKHVAFSAHDELPPGLEIEHGRQRSMRNRLVQFSDSDWCFLVTEDGRTLVHIEDEATFLANGFRWNEIEKLPASARANFSIVPDSDRAAMRRSGLRLAEHARTTSSEVSLVAQTPTTARVAVDRVRGGWLVWSKAHFPGWIARLDGQEVPLYRANFAFDAVLVPAGRHTVEFRYEPQSVRVGAWISALAALAGLVGLALESRLRSSAGSGR